MLVGFKSRFFSYPGNLYSMSLSWADIQFFLRYATSQPPMPIAIGRRSSHAAKRTILPGGCILHFWVAVLPWSLSRFFCGRGCTTNFPLDAFALLYFAFSLSFFQREGCPWDRVSLYWQSLKDEKQCHWLSSAFIEDDHMRSRMGSKLYSNIRPINIRPYPGSHLDAGKVTLLFVKSMTLP